VRAYPEPSECTKTVGGRGFAPDPTGGVYSAPPDPLAGFRGRRFAAQGRRFATREGKGQVGEGRGKGGKGREGEGRVGRRGKGREEVGPPTLKTVPAPLSQSRLDLEAERLGSRLGLGQAGLVSIPMTVRLLN
jgi:hypothetical protein